MTVEQEDKLRKSLGIFILLVFMPYNYFLNYYLSRDDAELYMIIPLMLVILIPASIIVILTFRKYSRDKNEGKDLKRYKTMLYWIVTSLLISFGFLIYVLLFI